MGGKDGVLTAIVLGSTVLVILIGVIVYKCYKRHNAARPHNFEAELQRLMEAGELSSSQAVRSSMPRELKRSNIMRLEQLGKGAFGEVWKAMLEEPERGVPAYTVAVKTATESNGEAAKDLLNESIVMAQVLFIV